MIFGLIGAKYSGKTTAAKIIQEIRPGYKRIAFRDAIKRALAAQYNIPLEEFYHSQTKEKYCKLMQSFSDNTRSVDPDCWVRRVSSQMIDDPGDYIIEDIRHINELALVVSKGGTLLKIETNIQTRHKRGMPFDKAAEQHHSEADVIALSNHVITELGGHIIYNNGSEFDLRKQIMDVVEHYRKV